ncbi:class I SAM-dependent methyltransferase [Candidatus Bathyarchaeota archaeon]|nr:class I SAM-dependent methyltransferase [Candidatus Bathyarchaeota archaeon]MBL7080920.1 class I SAM-dependent methyltransferase [Candidatus Bathyarchaeota archaeon]
MAEVYDKSVASTGYPGTTLKRVLGVIGTEHSVLEIGAGTGLLTIPVAKKARQVTVVEPSETMLRVLQSKILKEKISNVSIIKKKWENIDVGRVNPHDVLLAAYSLYMINIEEAIGRIKRLCKGSVLIIDSHLYENDGLRAADEILRKLLNLEELPYCSSYTLLANVLYQLGIHPNIEIMRKRKDTQWNNYIEFRKLRYYQAGGWSSTIEKSLLNELRRKNLIVYINGVPHIRRNAIEVLLWWEN